MDFYYARKVESEEPIMLIDKHIGYDANEGYGISGSRFAEEMMALDEMGKKRIQVWINSIGGNVMEGYNICMAMLKTKTKVDTYCGGVAASIAGVIFQCGRKRIMADYGVLMYHNPYNAKGESDSDGLNAIKDSLNKIICQKSGMDEQAMSAMMDRTTFINAEEAVTMNLCDEIESTATMNAPRLRAANNSLEMAWEECNTFLNKYFDNQKPRTMKLVMNKLGLNEDAAENSVVAAIEGMQNKLTEKDTEINNLKQTIQDKEAAAQKAADDLKEAQDKLAQLEKEKTDAEEAKALSEAQNMVKGYASQGRIKNDDVTIQSWVNSAVKDMEGTKNMLESLPLNKAAVTIGIVDNKDNKLPVTSAAMLTAQIRNKMNVKP